MFSDVRAVFQLYAQVKRSVLYLDLNIVVVVISVDFVGGVFYKTNSWRRNGDE